MPSQVTSSLQKKGLAAIVCDQPEHADGFLVAGLADSLSNNAVARLFSRRSPRSIPFSSAPALFIVPPSQKLGSLQRGLQAV